MPEENTEEETKAVSRQVRNYTLFILTIMYAFNFIDRQIIVILQPLIKAELNLSDTQLGLLSGIVFALFYTILGIPIARLADKRNRRNIIAISLTIWSGMTAISGFAQNFMQLLLARLGVGVGEAGGSPPAHSMISDLYDEKSRATAISIYSAGLHFGILVGFAFGGYLGELYGWRTTFFVVGIPGVLLALVIWLTVPEPVRGTFDNAKVKDAPSFKETVATVFKLKSFIYIALGCAFSAFVGYGAINFMPSYLIRYHNMSLTDVGLVLALVVGTGGMVGTFLGGYLADKFGRNDLRWYLWVPSIAILTGTPIMIFAYHSGNLYVMLSVALVGIIAGNTYLGPSIAIAHKLVNVRMRATISALLFFILNLIGLGLGPLYVGWLSDTITGIRGVESLDWALTGCALVGILAAFLFWRGGYKLQEDLKQTEGNNG